VAVPLCVHTNEPLLVNVWILLTPEVVVVFPPVPLTLDVLPRKSFIPIAAVAPVGMAGVTGEYEPATNLKFAPRPLDGVLIVKPNSFATFVKLIAPVGVGILMYNS
jgi:hypothetical protein